MIEDCTGKLHSSNTVSVCNASVQWIVLYAVFLAFGADYSFLNY